MTIFRPSSRVRLTLRAEEFNDTAALEARLPPATLVGANAPPVATKPPVDPRTARTSPDALLKENQNALLSLFSEFDGLSPEEFREQQEQLRLQREALQASAVQQAIGLSEDELRAEVSGALQGASSVLSGGGVPPASVAGTPPDDLTSIGEIEPISVSIERNGLGSADTCTVVLDAADAPFDPRVLRAAHVEVVLGVVTAEEYEAGLRGERRADGSLLSLVASDVGARSVTRFVGFVDEISTSYSDSGDTVTLECRDMSAILRDGRMPEGLAIDLTLPLDEGVAQFITAASAQAAGVRVRFLGEGSAPVPEEATGPATRTGTARRRVRRGARATRGRRGGENMSLWDHITDVCRATGFLPVVDGYDVVIAEARTLYSSTGVRRMVYGRNLSDLSFSRRLQGQKVPTIEVRCYDPALGRTRWARWPTRTGERASGVLGVDNPPAALRANEVPPSGATPEESINVLQVSGTSDPAVLERVARNAFEQIGRQEIEGSFSTADAHSYDAPEDAVDLMTINAGDPVELLIVSSVPPELADRGTNTTLAQLQAMTRERRRDYLIARGWPDSVATRFAALQEANEFQTVFRAQDVRLTWEREGGFKVQVGFINYVVVREENVS